MTSKRIRLGLVASLAIAGIALVAVWRTPPPGHATPADCIHAYGEASTVGDAAAYLTCLAEPLRSQTEQRFPDRHELADSLRRHMKDVKAWVQHEPVISGSRAQVEADEVRQEGTRRIRFRLQSSRCGWLIVGIEGPKNVGTPVPYGSHVTTIEGP